MFCQAAYAQTNYTLRDVNVRNQANNVLTLMTFTLVPDVTTSTLAINASSTENPTLTMFTLGGGDAISREFPLYLEGTLGYSRYDPKFLISDGTTQSRLPIKWNSLSLSGGIGWDFRLNDELVLRPIINIALGQVTSDLRIGEYLLSRILDREIHFLKNGSMTAYGLGASLMLDWERIRPDYEFDLEARYSHIDLQTFGNTDESVKGTSAADTFNIWARYRAPTGLTAMQRPVRYVLESAHSRFFGAQQDALGFDNLTSFGVGIELDSSAYDLFVSRIRLVARRMYGQNVSGASVGLAVSF